MGLENETASVLFMSAKTTTGYSDPVQPRDTQKSVQVYGTTSAGAGAVLVRLQVSNFTTPVLTTDADWTTLADLSLILGTTQVNKVLTDIGAYRHLRAKVVSISGTNAQVNSYLGA
jgi:hypothetical protein